MKQRATNLLTVITLIMVAILVSMHFALHFKVLPATGFREQQFLSIETFIIGFLLAGIMIILLIKQIPIWRRTNKAQMELFISNEFFSSTLMSIGDGVISTDAAGAITFMNKTAEQLTGRSLTESKGKAIEFACDIVNEHTQVQIENPVKKALKENRIISLSNHTLMIKRDESFHYIDESATPYHDDEGKILGAILIFRDVTERYATSKKLDESESRLKNMMHNTHSLVYIKDLQGKFLMMNRHNKKSFNMKEGDVSGTDSPGYPLELPIEDLQVVKQKRLIESEKSFKHSDGSFHTCHTTRFPLYNAEGKIFAVCGIATDVSESYKNTELKKENPVVQEAPLKSEIRYAELTEHMPNMFFFLDPSMQFRHFNKACEKFTGITAENVIGKSIEKAFPDMTPQFLTAYNEVLRTGIAKNFISDFKFSNNAITAIVNIYPAVGGISVLMSDITEQKKAEEEIIILNEELDQIIVERTVKLEAVSKDLESFTYSVSHDLRAPLRAVNGYARMLEEDYSNLLDTEGKRLLGEVQQNSQRMGRLIDDLLAFSKLGRKKITASLMDMDVLMKAVLSEVKESTNHHAEIKISSLLPAMGDHALMVRVMINLLKNAIKYSSKKEKPVVEIKSKQEHGMIVYSVHDNGVGFDMKYSNRLFGVFQRLHSTEEFPGTGVGLATVQRIINKHEGKVWGEGTVGEGATFYFSLPAPKAGLTAGQPVPSETKSNQDSHE